MWKAGESWSYNSAGALLFSVNADFQSSSRGFCGVVLWWAQKT
jgi:hypothetical protein